MDPRRILVYTHNAVGLGHAVRVGAVIDGLKARLPEADFLVLTGSSAPELFLGRGVETVKLPGLCCDVDLPGAPFRPRLLRSLDRDALLDWRGRIIAESLRAFSPDLVVIEHAPAGLFGEAAPLLAGSRAATGAGHRLVHLSRGVFRDRPALLVPAENPPGLPSGFRVLDAYDAFFVLEDRGAVDVNAEFFGADPALEERIHYLGPVTARNRDELAAGPARPPGFERASPFMLVSLGRCGRVEALHDRALDAFERLDLGPGAAALVVFDPYLDPAVAVEIALRNARPRLHFSRFIPRPAEITAQADLVVCRAGCNMVNELRLTGRPALVTPESHPSREQERRAAGLTDDRIAVMAEEEFLSRDLAPTLARLLEMGPRPEPPPPGRFDRFLAAERMLDRLRELPASPTRRVRNAAV